MAYITIDEVRMAFPKGAMVGGEWLTHCPMPGHKHGDANPSLSIGVRNGDLVVCCRSGDHSQDDLFNIVTSKLSGNGGQQESSAPMAEKKPKPSQASGWQGFTLDGYCKLKGLLSGTLTHFFDVKEAVRRGKPVVAFPYCNEDSSLRLTKIRLSESSHDTFTEPTGADLLPFGLQNPALRYSKPGTYDLYIAEGETDCLTLAQFGYPAIAISGAQGWKPDFAVLDAVENARQIFVAEQQDDAGRGLTEKILSDLPDALVLRPAHGVKDFNEMWLKSQADGGEFLGETYFLMDIKAAEQNARLERALRKPKQDAARPKGMRDEAFYGLAGKIVRLLEPYLEVDRAAILANVLACIGVLFERKAYAKVAADFHYPIDYFLIVGDTAKARKGTTTNSVLELAERVRPQFKSRVLYSLSTGEGLINAVSESNEEKKEVAKAKYPVAFVSMGELAGLLAVMERKENTLSSVLRDAWDGKPLQVNTRHLRLCVENVSLGIIANVTRSDLVKVNAIDIGNGFINRFMFIWSERGKLLPEGANIESLFSSEAWFLVLKELNEAVLAAEGLGEVPRAPETAELWKPMYYDFNRGGDSIVDKLIARNDAHTVRLSVVYALLDRSPVIRPRHLEAARAVWDYSEASIRYIFSVPDVEAQKILDALEDGPLTTSEVRVRVFKQHKATEYVAEKMAGLEKDRKVRRVVKRKDSRGYNKTAWALNI
jgi:hypothetical protein